MLHCDGGGNGKCFDGCFDGGLSNSDNASFVPSAHAGGEVVCCNGNDRTVFNRSSYKNSHEQRVSSKLNSSSTSAAKTSKEESILLSTLTKRKLKSPEEVDTLLAKELNSLSIDERQKVLEEVHGVLQPTIETNEFINERLDRLDKEVTKIRKKASYDLAMFMSPAYVTNRKFRLMFLRAETNYNPTLAAQKLINHFEYKLELFGVDNLVKDITQQDLINIHNQEEAETRLKRSLMRQEEEQSQPTTPPTGDSAIEKRKATDVTTTASPNFTADDVNEESTSTLLSALQSGSTQKLAIKDQVGRTIMVSCWEYLPSNVRHQVSLLICFHSCVLAFFF